MTIAQPHLLTPLIGVMVGQLDLVTNEALFLHCLQLQHCFSVWLIVLFPFICSWCTADRIALQLLFICFTRCGPGLAEPPLVEAASILCFFLGFSRRVFARTGHLPIVWRAQKC